MSKLKPVFEAVLPIFKAHDFRKSGNNFYRVSAGTINVFNFQGSSGGTTFYLNQGTGPFEPRDDAKKLSAADLRVRSSGRIVLFSDAGDWLYDMADVERSILCRKIEERINESEDPERQEVGR